MNAGVLLEENTKLKNLVARKDNRIQELEEQVHLLQTLHFGSSSEKLTVEDKNQKSLFNEAEDSAFDQQIEVPTETREVKSYKKNDQERRRSKTDLRGFAPRGLRI